MIVDPDFLDHWRTRMLVDGLGGDEFAPMYLIRLWGHCQTRRATRFDIPPAGLKGLCRSACDGANLERALTEAGYIQRDGAFVEVLKWADQNSSLLAAWENGGKGGRPPKPKANPGETHQEPNGNPGETQAKPIREEKRREESKGETEVIAAASASPSQAEPPPPHSAASPENASTAQRAPRATRLPADFEVPDEWRQWAAEQFPAWSSEALALEASKFADHWHAVPGKDGLKLDWAGTWRNWCRRARPVPQARASPGRRTWTEQQTETIAGLTGASKRPEVIDVIAKRVG